MLNQKSQVKKLVSQFKHLEIGRTREKLNILEDLEMEDCMIQNQLQQKMKTQEKNMSTVESHVLNNQKILKDKSNTCKKNIQTMKLLKKSQAELTSKETPLKGFWTKQSTEISKKLWLPTKTGYVGSHGTISNGCSLVSESISSLMMERNILQNQSSQMISFQSSMYSLVDTTVKGGNILISELKKTIQKKLQSDENKRNAITNKRNGTSNVAKKIDVPTNFIPKTRKIQIIPTCKQRRIINDNIASVRKIWNLCVEDKRADLLSKINKPFLTLENIKKETSFTENMLRDKYVIKKNMTSEMIDHLEWTFRTQKRIREYAVKDFISSYKGGITRLHKKQNKQFRINSKNKNDYKQTICLPHEGSLIKNNMLHVCGMDIKIKHKIQDQNILNNMRLSRIGLNYFVNITYYEKEKEVKNIPLQSIVGIDPGENIPLTYYSPEGEYGFIGIGLKEKLLKMYSIKKSMIDKMKNEYKLIKAIKKLESKTLNMVDDFHWKACHFLLSKYNKIIIPSLYVRNCSKERKQLQADMRHCEFVNRLISKSIEYDNVEIHHCKERYTTQTCTNCGSRKTVKNSTVKCKVCGFEIHRDLSGSRNMVLKHLSI